jgi:phosphoserine aminotransferase
VRSDFVVDLAEISGTLLGTSHRRPAVKGWVARLREGLEQFFDLPEGYKIGLGNGGASLAWEMANLGLFEKSSGHFVYGEFSSKWYSWAKMVPWISPLKTDAEYGTLPEFQPLEGVDAYCFTNCETSTGVGVPSIPRLDDSSLICCDATSAAGGFNFNWSNIDFLFFSPQKCFGSEGGLTVFVASPRALERHERIASDSSRYIPTLMNLGEAVNNAAKDQTYNTPSVSTIYLMARQIEWMNAQGGMRHWAGIAQEKADFLYGWATARDYAAPFVQNPAHRSPTVATIDFSDEVSADDLCKIARANGILDIEAYRKLGRNQIRVAMFPNVSLDNLKKLTQSLEFIISKIAG